MANARPPSIENGTATEKATKKTVAKGLLDVSLLITHAGQLNDLFDIPFGPLRDGIFYAKLVMLFVAIILQIATAAILMVLGSRKARTEDEKKASSRLQLNTVSVALALAITVVNSFITGFKVDYRLDPVDTDTSTCT